MIELWRERNTSSTYRPTDDSRPKFCELVPMPRIAKEAIVDCWLRLTTSDGACSCSAYTSCTPESVSIWPVTAVTATGMSCRDSSRRVAVTMISSMTSSCACTVAPVAANVRATINDFAVIAAAPVSTAPSRIDWSLLAMGFPLLK